MLTTHTHQLAKKSRLLPSSPRMLFSPFLSPSPGDRSRDLRDGRMLRTNEQTGVGREWLLLLAPAWLSGEPSTCWRAALCTSMFRSQACPLGLLEQIPASACSSPFSQALCTPSLAQSRSSEQEVSCFLCAWDSPGSAALRAEELFNFPMSLSRSNPLRFRIGPV